MNDASESNNQIKAEDEASANGTLTPKDELDHLLRGIEETSKHARSVLFALTTSSGFVVVAALSRAVGDVIKLPIAGNEISREQFFFWSPLLILATYVYLQVYIQELIGRFTRLYEFEQRTSLSPSIPRDLLFPWLFVIALEARRQRELWTPKDAIAASDRFARTARSSNQPVPHLYLLGVVIIWLFGPAVLAILLFVFVREEKVVALVPCAAFLTSSLVAIRFVRERRSRIESAFWLAAAATVVMITLASVPELRERTYLGALWDLRHHAGEATKAIIRPVLSTVAAFGVPAATFAVMGWTIYARVKPLRVYRQRVGSELNQADRAGRSLREYFVPLRGSLRSDPGVEVNLTDFVASVRRAVIVGTPGSGKTTLLKYWGLRILDGKPPFRHVLPIFIRLRRVGGGTGNLVKVAITTLREYGVPKEAMQFHRLASAGRVAFLLDGLDEVAPGIREETIKEIQALVGQFPSCRIYITSRAVAYHGELDSVVAETVTLAPLSAADSAKLLQQLFDHDPSRGDEIRTRLSELGRSEVFQNPLLLTLAADTFSRLGALPTSEEGLLEELVRSRLSDWDRARQISSLFSFDQKIMFLRSLAKVMDAKGEPEIARSEALETGRAVVSETGAAGAVENLIDEVVRSGLIIETSAEGLAFSHRRIQDYFGGGEVPGSRRTRRRA